MRPGEHAGLDLRHTVHAVHTTPHHTHTTTHTHTRTRTRTRARAHTHITRTERLNCFFVNDHVPPAFFNTHKLKERLHTIF